MYVFYIFVFMNTHIHIYMFIYIYIIYLFFHFLSELNVCVRRDKRTFKCVCNSSDFQRRAPSLIPLCRPDWSRAGGWPWTARPPWTEQGKEGAARWPTALSPSVDQPSRSTNVLCWKDWPTAAWPSFTRVSFHVLIWQKNAWKSSEPAPTGLTYMTEAPRAVAEN